MSKSVKYGILIASIGGFITTMLIQIVAVIQFDREYAGHLKRAADANSLRLAKSELEIALVYLNTNGYDADYGRNKGIIDDYTSVLYSTPNEQISFHYNNISDSYNEVCEVMTNSEASPLEKSNVLMKLRETLLDSSKKGQKVTYPPGLHIYPMNLIIGTAELISLTVFFIMFFVTYKKWR